MKNVLFFYPDNITRRDSGNKIRALELLKYFKSSGFSVDLVSTSDYSHDWNEESVNWLLENKLVSNVHILSRKGSKKNLITYFFSYKLPFLLQNKEGVLTNLASYPLQRQFNEILKKKSFDHIVISYANWAGLICNNPYIGKAKTIIDTHDFMTSQSQNNKRFKLGASFEEEIKRLQYFNEIWVISTDEQYIFTQFCKNTVRLITSSMECYYHYDNATPAQKPYDIIYVASDNAYNQQSAKWFFECVYPLLPTHLNICVIGKITRFIKDYPNVVKVPFAENLSSYYQNAKLAICPMLKGTGIKIKVIEALSYGLPVVGTLRAIDGLPNKIQNGCLISDEPKTFAKHIDLLLSDGKKYQEQQTYAREMFESCFSTEVGYKHLNEAFNVV